MSSQVQPVSSQDQPVENSLGRLAQEGKFLTFVLGQEEYGLEILKVREIIGYMEITHVPKTPDYIKGIINLRGKVIPIVDLRTHFGMEAIDVTEATCIIVVEITREDRHIETGIIVDQVSEVLDITAEQIEATPEFGSSVDTQFILGMGKIGDSVKILLEIDQVLNSGEIIDIAASVTEVAEEATA